jgi:NADH:ubiquinone oxidoreductase subunit C
MTGELAGLVGREAPAVENDLGVPATLDVEPDRWLPALRSASQAGARFFDMLTAYDLLADGVAVVAHVSTPDAAEHLLLRTRLPVDALVLPSAVAVYRGAAWHEREVHEMYGVVFTGHPGLDPLLLSDGAPVTPLRKSVLLAARSARPWPGHHDPADSTGRPRRRTLPPGVAAEEPS